MVVDDSAVVRSAMRDVLSRENEIGKVETAANGKIALRKLERCSPDVVTMDVQMPGMDGLETLEKIMEIQPRPVIMLSAYTFEGAEKTIRALELGAVDFIQKPSGRLQQDIKMVGAELAEKIRAVASVKRKRALAIKAEPVKPAILDLPAADSVPEAPRKIVAFGASTGGTEALRYVLTRLPADFPAGIVVTQHMPQGFTHAFASRLNSLCALSIKEAAHRDLIAAGRVLIAPGHSHMVVNRDQNLAYVDLNRLPKVSGHRPSVDVLFKSVAEAYGSASIGVILTGMGRDGAEGMKRMHDCQANTIAQNKESCVVYGMPKAAVEEGGVDAAADIMEIPNILIDLVMRQKPLRAKRMVKLLGGSVPAV